MTTARTTTTMTVASDHHPWLPGSRHDELVRNERRKHTAKKAHPSKRNPPTHALAQMPRRVLTRRLRRKNIFFSGAQDVEATGCAQDIHTRRCCYSRCRYKFSSVASRKYRERLLPRLRYYYREFLIPLDRARKERAEQCILNDVFSCELLEFWTVFVRRAVSRAEVASGNGRHLWSLEIHCLIKFDCNLTFLH